MLLNVKIVGLGIGKNVIKDVIAHNLIAYNGLYMARSHSQT